MKPCLQRLARKISGQTLRILINRYMAYHGYSSGGSSGGSSGSTSSGSSGSTGSTGSSSSSGASSSSSESSYSSSGGYSSSTGTTMTANQTLNTITGDFFTGTAANLAAEQELIRSQLRSGLPPAPSGYHYMDNGELMLGDMHMEEGDPDPNYKASRQFNGGQSDYNLGRSSTVASGYLYSDLPLAMRVHPELHDIRPLKDIAAVKQSVKNLVLSGIYDRPFRPDLGCSLVDYLFEPVGATTSISMGNEIRRILQRKEPRIANVDVVLLDNSDRNAYDCTITFTVIQYNADEDVNLYLERLK